METLNDQDIDALTEITNKLIRLRRRECANANRLSQDFTVAIEKVEWVRSLLCTRLGRVTHVDQEYRKSIGLPIDTIQKDR